MKQASKIWTDADQLLTLASNVAALGKPIYHVAAIEGKNASPALELLIGRNGVEVLLTAVRTVLDNDGDPIACRIMQYLLHLAPSFVLNTLKQMAAEQRAADIHVMKLQSGAYALHMYLAFDGDGLKRGHRECLDADFLPGIEYWTGISFQDQNAA